MSQPQSDRRHSLAAHAPAPPLVIRLTIGHLLLWTATTAVALTWLVGQKPPPSEEIGFASFLSTPGADREAEKAKARRQIWRQWQNQYLVGLASAPVYGAALAGGVLAILGLIMRRGSFPLQPGHWLLVLIAVFALLVAARPHLSSLLRFADGPDCVVALLMAATSLFVTVRIRDIRWRIPSGLAAVGLGVICLAYVQSFVHPRFDPPGLFVLGLLLLAGIPLSALITTMSDIALRAPRDAFHWVGVAALFGVMAQIVASRLVARL